MNNDKTLESEIIEDQPFPQDINGIISPAVVGGGENKRDETVTSPVTKTEGFPNIPIAHHLISESLDTIEKRILDTYQFSPTGALQIGDYEDGNSGDMRFTRDGVVARNVNGETTFSIDGATGDAVFMGILQAGTLVGGDNKAVIDADNGNGRIILYDANDVPFLLLGYGQGLF